MKLGRYETLVRLGRGGMAEVFAARLSGEAGFAKLVAIKRMLPHLSSDPALHARFLDEARVAALVTSPYVVQTLDVGRGDDGQPFIVLELVLGVSLAHLLSQRPLPSLAVRVELVTQAALGLADVHEARAADGASLEIVHRDVSPHNILVGSDGRARLADFGIARANLPREDTRTGVVLGKWGYMAPEQVRAGAIDARSDVYAMGAVAWETLTGRRLHDNASTPEQITRRILSGHLPSLIEAEPTLPRALTDVVERALAHDPRDRYPNGRELAEALRAASRGLGPPVPQRTLVDEVRRAAGSSLAELESVLAELDESATEERTATIGFEGATVSALLGIEWDPATVTAPLAPEEPTQPDAITPAREASTIASTWPEGTRRPAPTANAIDPTTRGALRPLFWVALVAGTVLLGAIGAAVGATIATPDAPPPAAPEPRPMPEAIAPPNIEPDPEPPAPVIDDPPVAPAPRRPRRRAEPRIDREPTTRSQSGPLLGADRFDAEER